jgi:hypothetical protein
MILSRSDTSSINSDNFSPPARCSPHSALTKGHSDLQVMRRYLAQNDQDNQLAHMRGGPVDNNF